MINFDELIKQTQLTIEAVENDINFITDKALQEYAELYKEYLDCLRTNNIDQTLKKCKRIIHINSRCYLETSSYWNKSCLVEMDNLCNMNRNILINSN